MIVVCSRRVSRIASLWIRIFGSSDIFSRLYRTTSSQYSSPISSGSNYLRRLYSRDWLAPNEVVKIFETVEPESVVPVFNHISKRKDYQPKEALYSVVIRKLGEARNFGAIDDVMEKLKTQKALKLSDDFFRDVIKVYGHTGGLIDKAVDTLLHMPTNYCVLPSVKTLNFVLNLLVNTKQFDIIHDVFLSASKLGVEIDACCLNILIKGLCADGCLDDAYQVLDEFTKLGCQPNVRSFSTIMRGLCEHGKLDEAFDLFDRMKMEGILPDKICYNILISGLRKQKSVDNAMQFLHGMNAEGSKPNSGSYQEVLNGLLESGRFNEARDLIGGMTTKGIRPSFASYKLIILDFCKENKLQEADSVLKVMVEQGFAPSMGMWRALVEKVFSGKLNPISCQFPVHLSCESIGD